MPSNNHTQPIQLKVESESLKRNRETREKEAQHMQNDSF